MRDEKDGTRVRDMTERERERERDDRERCV